MLSILIPTYNQSCLALVEELSIEIDLLDIEAEIIVLDDASTDAKVIREMSDIELVDHVRVVRHTENQGIMKVRFEIAAMAKYDHILFLDADTFPTTTDYLAKYVNEIGKADIVYGGVRYRINGPHPINPLRLAYGQKYEVRSVGFREKNPYASIKSFAFLANKSKLYSLKYDEAFGCSGPGDNLFAKRMMESGVTVKHIYNPVFHDDNDTSEQFLSKLRAGANDLLLHTDDLCEMSRMLRIFLTMKRFGLVKIMRFVFRHFEKRMEKNLLGKNPSVAVLNIYRVTYMACSMKLM